MASEAGVEKHTCLAVEIASQPQCWRRAEAMAGAVANVLPRPGERVAVVGCGTSWFVAQAYAALRERAGHGWTDAFTASEMPTGRTYDRVLVLTRSGTTTEILDLLARLRRGGTTLPTVAVTGVPSAPVVNAVDHAVVIDFADERSVVQTRFATTTLALLRRHLGETVEPVAAQAAEALRADLPAGLVGARQFTFLGSGWTVGLANEAALKLREAALAWADSYPAMEYRHGPISLAGEGNLVWFLCEPPPGLAEEIRGTGAAVVVPGRDPLAELVLVHRLAAAVAEAKGLDPDHPRNLTRSVILPPAAAS